MYRLYWRQHTGAFLPHALLELVGAPWEKIATSRDEQRAPAHLALNPLGQIPTLILPDGTVLTETGAMLLHLADLHPELAPSPKTPERARFYRWLMVLSGHAYEAELRESYPDRYTTDPGGAEGVRDAARERMHMLWRVIADQLEPGPYILGGRFSAVDVYLLMLLTWYDRNPTDPRLLRIREAVMGHAAVRRAWDECLQR